MTRKSVCVPSTPGRRRRIKSYINKTPSGTIRIGETYDACVHEALANAVRRMNYPALDAVQKSHTAP
jgi:hypothetical protein